MNRPASLPLRLRVAFVVTAFFLWVMVADVAHCGEPVGPPAPKAHTMKPRAMVSVDLADRMAAHAFVLGLGTSADLFSTAAALKRCPACIEANPLGFDVEARLALKLGMGTVALGVVWKLERDDHSTWAKVIRWGIFAIYAYATAVNTLHAIRRQR